MATVDVPLLWNKNNPTSHFTVRQRSLSVASGLSSRASVRLAASRRPKLSILYDFRRSYSLRKKDSIHLEAFQFKVYRVLQ